MPIGQLPLHRGAFNATPVLPVGSERTSPPPPPEEETADEPEQQEQEQEPEEDSESGKEPVCGHNNLAGVLHRALPISSLKDTPTGKTQQSSKEQRT